MRDQLALWQHLDSAQPEERLRWSVSRDRRLRECPRKYYYYHYGSRDGQRELIILKYLSNRYMWVGEVVHDLIEETLGLWQRGQDISPEVLIERGTRRMRAEYAESSQGAYRKRPGQACGLVEHEYSEPMTRGQWRQQHERMARCLQNFFTMPEVQEIHAIPSWRWLSVEGLESFELEGATIVVKPDLAWRDDQGHVVIVDWKTGKPHGEADRLQLAVYALLARERWDLGGESLETCLVYLDDAKVDRVRLDTQAIHRAETYVRDSVLMMRDLVKDLDIERFARTEDLSACARCVFRRPCGREGVAVQP